jgi:hypothetical protein
MTLSSSHSTSQTRKREEGQGCFRSHHVSFGEVKLAVGQLEEGGRDTHDGDGHLKS